ncbi:MAG: YceI family protein [Actinobacteria bacterium]|nr:YceI family protein [Actinomycetota bacterium]MCL6105466.1 YceI family protein [Actinomycetota bacterium]
MSISETEINNQQVQLPPAGTYELDATHTTIAFVARHLMVAKVKGRFGQFSGTIKVAEEPTNSSVQVTIQAASIDTRESTRDNHLRSADFLDVENYPTLQFKSTGVELSGSTNSGRINGELTIRGVTKPVVLEAEFNGSIVDMQGTQRIGFTATAEIDREDWGLTYNAVLEGGGMLISKKITIELEVEAIKQ